jgi:hypothetical protein
LTKRRIYTTIRYEKFKGVNVDTLQFFKKLERSAKGYRQVCQEEILKNPKNEISNDSQIEQFVIDEILCGFINYMSLYMDFEYRIFPEGVRGKNDR